MPSRRPTLASFSIRLAALALVGTASAQVLNESAVLVPVDSSEGDQFGVSVAISGDTALSWSSPPRATVTARNGSGSNPASLSSQSRPVLGGIWTASLECAGSNARARLEARRLSAAGTLAPFGEVLFAGALWRRSIAVPALARATFAWASPGDLSRLGRVRHVQGLCTSSLSGGPKLAARGGTLSNALDLVLGY